VYFLIKQSYVTLSHIFPETLFERKQGLFQTTTKRKPKLKLKIKI